MKYWYDKEEEKMIRYAENGDDFILLEDRCIFVEASRYISPRKDKEYIRGKFLISDPWYKIKEINLIRQCFLRANFFDLNILYKPTGRSQLPYRCLYKNLEFHGSDVVDDGLLVNFVGRNVFEEITLNFPGHVFSVDETVSFVVDGKRFEGRVNTMHYANTSEFDEKQWLYAVYSPEIPSGLLTLSESKLKKVLLSSNSPF